MIERYSHPEMARIWSEDYKYDLWLRLEVAVAEAWAEEGVVPREAAEAVRRNAALLATCILGLKHEDIRRAYQEYCGRREDDL